MIEPYVPTGRPRARRRGCLLKGCLTIFIVVMLMGVIIGGAGTYIYYGIAPFLTQDAVSVRIYPATDAQYQEVLARILPFNEAVAAGTRATLDLSAEDLDILIARDPAWADLRAKLYMALDHDDDLMADVSTPTDESDNNQVQLFFNGRLVLGASIAGGEFTAVMRRIETLSGKPLPALLARFITSPGFAQSFDEAINVRIKDNPRVAGYLAKLRTATIEHHRIHVISAGQPVPAPQPSPPAAATPSPGVSPPGPVAPLAGPA